MAEMKKLTVRVDEKWIEAAKAYAREHNTSLSRLISEFFKTITTDRQRMESGPVLRRLSGILPADITRDEHREHLAEKYGG